MAQKRFEIIYSEGLALGPEGSRSILLDKATGVYYLNTKSPMGEGLTPLLDPYGKPIVMPPQTQPQMPMQRPPQMPPR